MSTRLGDFSIKTFTARIALFAGAVGLASVLSLVAYAQTTERVLVILVNFTNDTSQPFTPAEVANNFFLSASSTNAYYQENSFGAIALSGDVVGWYTLPSQNTGCQVSAWAQQAEAAALAAGVDTASYSHHFYVFNSSAGCPFGGIGSMGGNPTQAWVAGSDAPAAFAHEFGHNLGLQHAQRLDCITKQIDTYANCSLSDYGDSSSVMGSTGYFGHFMPEQKILLDWMNPVSQQTVTTSGTYTVTPDENNDGTLKVLKIAKPNTGDYYYISVRQATGFDVALPAEFSAGVSVHIWSGVLSDPTKIIDTTPNDNNNSNAPLSDGKSFSDPANGITITQLSHTNSSATVSVQFTPVTCTRAAPSVSITPSTQGNNAGFGVTYMINITNNDSLSCSALGLDLSVALPAGWGNSIVPHVTVSPGSSISSPMGVNSASTATDGSYPIVVSYVDAATSRQGSSTATFVVGTPVPQDTTAPTTKITSPANNATVKNTVTVSATASDAVGVTRVELWVDGALLTTDTTSPYSFSWNTTTLTNGTHTLQSKAYDAAGNVGTSATVNAKVSNPDTTAPTVTITSPTNGATVTGTFTVSATASDASGVSSIVLKIDGTTKKTCTNTTSCSFAQSASSLSRGSHSITATAKDPSGNSKTATITVRR